VQYTAFVA